MVGYPKLLYTFGIKNDICNTVSYEYISLKLKMVLERL